MQKIWANYKGMSVQAKAAIWFAMCSVLQKGISFITIPIFTRLLTAEQYGTYSLYLSWLQILTIITSLNLYYGVFNNGMTKFEEHRDGYIASMQGLTMTLTAVVFLVYLLACEFWSELLGLAPAFVVMMFVEMLVAPALRFWSGRQRFEFRYKRLVTITLAKSAANPILGIITVLLAQDRAAARVASVVVVEVIFCGTMMLRQFIKGKLFYHSVYWKYALKLAVPLLPHYLSGTVLGQGDRIMIDRMIGKAEVAFYGVAYSIGMLAQIFTTAITNSFTPWMYQKLKSNSFDGIQKTVDMLLAVVGTISAGLMLLAPEMVLIFGSEEYTSAVYVVPPVAASVFFIFLYQILAIPQFYYEKTKFLALSSLLAAVINVVLNYIFIKQFGYVAAGYTTLICYILYSLGHYLVSRKVLKEFLGGRELYDKRMILAVSVAIVLFAIGCNYVFDLWYIRYGLLASACVIAYAKRIEIIGLLQGVRRKNNI